MKIFGLPVPFTGKQKALHSVNPSPGWVRILESVTGAWQYNISVDLDSVVSNPAIFSCQTLIASDIAKLRVKLVQRLAEQRIWVEVDNFNYKVLVKPNHFQTRIQFFESWMLSKLQYGNTYVLKQKDKDLVTALYILDPTRVRPMIADNGDVFYELQSNELAGIGRTVLVPAREMIHDRFNCLRHPLVGISPIFAAGLSGALGLAIQKQATKFFENGARPGGILSAPGEIADATATRLKAYFDDNFTGEKAGKVAVLGDGLKYEQLGAKAVDSQLAEQWKLTAEVICGVYHVPAFMIGAGSEPNYNNVQNLTLRYYSQCLQTHIEAAEILLDEGLGLRGELGGGSTLGTEFDLDGLLRMDTATQYDILAKAKDVLQLNERRRKVDMPAIEGGDTIFMQHQDHSMEAIAARDAQLIDLAENPPEKPSNVINLNVSSTQRKFAIPKKRKAG